MISSPLKNEGWLYWLAFLIALGLRLLQLGASPLNDAEAGLALQALHIAQGQAPLLSSQPGYILLTAILFGVMEATNFMARFVPAAVGSMLVFAPYFFRDRIKQGPALVLAFLFAIDPGLVALSRQAGGTILAVVFLIFTWAAWRHGRATATGIFAGLALLAGPSLWAGLLVLGLTRLFFEGMGTTPAPGGSTPNSDASPGEMPVSQPSLTRSSTLQRLRATLPALLLTLLFGGTLFFLSPNGLSAWLLALPEYLAGWVSPPSTTPGRVLLAFFAYEPLGIFLASLALYRAYRTKSRRVLRLGLWLGVALLLAVFYRQVSELVWVTIPLLTLAALELSRAFRIYAEERVEVGLVVLALMILLVYVWFDVSKIALDPVGSLSPRTLPLFGGSIEIPGAPYIVLLGAFLIILLCISFVAFGWSQRTAWLGTTWAFVIFLGMYSLASAWGASGLRAPGGLELWSSDPPPAQVDLLRASLDDVSEFSLGHDRSQPVTLIGVSSPALEWALRGRTVETIAVLDPQIAPPIVITPFMEGLDLPAAYRGQDFVWRRQPLWEQIQNTDWIRWLVFRQLPRQDEIIILWVRDDLFPDARETVQ